MAQKWAVFLNDDDFVVVDYNHHVDGFRRDLPKLL
jgi:hypothetical protein